jgi:type II secretory pathway component PulC
MQSKGTTYLLIGLFALIWLVAGYRVYKAVHKDEVPDSMPMQVSKVSTHELDSFALSLNYEDPFELKSRVIEPAPIKELGNANVISKPLLQKLKEPDYKPSGISFKGVINNFTGKRKVAIINIQGRDITISENETVGVMTLLRVYNEDSISLQYDGHKIVIKR